MKTKEQLKQEIEETTKKLDQLKEEFTKVSIEQSDLKGKYIYLKYRNLYMHVEDFWYSGDYEIILEGETFGWCISEYADDTYFRWGQYDQITEKMRAGSIKDEYTEISEKEFKEKRNQALEELSEIYPDCD